MMLLRITRRGFLAGMLGLGAAGPFAPATSPSTGSTAPVPSPLRIPGELCANGWDLSDIRITITGIGQNIFVPIDSGLSRRDIWGVDNEGGTW